MKKIDIQHSLRERVKSTEWTDKDTWNVLDRVRAAGKTRGKHRLTFLLPAAAMLVLAVCVGVVSIVKPGTPDLVRPTVHIMQPLALSHSGESASAGNGETADVDFLSGEEEALSILRESCPEIPAELKPVRVEYEEQGIRVEIVSALVRDHSSWILWTLQDLEGERINESSADYFYDPNNIGEAEEYGYYCKHYDAEQKKLTVLEEIRYSSMNEPEDGMYSFSLIDLYTYEHETVDLKPLLEKYWSDIEGVSPPDHTRPYYGAAGDPVPQDLKTLDYESPANIPLTGKGKLLLTGIGWVGGKLHVQIHEADRAFCGTDEDGVSLIRNNSVYITNKSAGGNAFESPADSPYAWEDPANLWDEWLEFVFDSTRNDQETMTLTADLFFWRKTVKGSWTFGIPVSMIREEEETETAETGNLPAGAAGPASGAGMSAYSEHVLSTLQYSHPELADKLQPVNAVFEKDGIRLEVLSAVITGENACVVYTLQDMKGGRDISGMRGTASLTDGDGAVYMISREYSWGYDAEERRTAFLGIFDTKDVRPGEHTVSLNIRDVCLYESAQADLMPLLEQYAPAGGEMAEADIPLFRTARLTGIGWADGQLHIQLRSSDYKEVDLHNVLITGIVPDADGNISSLNSRLTDRRDLEIDGEARSQGIEFVLDVSPDETDKLEDFGLLFSEIADEAEGPWEAGFTVTAVPEEADSI